MSPPLFCFGSLMDLDVLRLVIGDNADTVEMQSGSLPGFYKARLPHESYPMLVAAAEEEAQGQLIYGLSPESLDRIIFFEGEEYELTPCKVRCNSGELVSALFFDEGNMPPPVTETWDFDHWRDHYKNYMLRQSAKYRAYYGEMTAADADTYWQNYEE